MWLKYFINETQFGKIKSIKDYINEIYNYSQRYKIKIINFSHFKNILKMETLNNLSFYNSSFYNKEYFEKIKEER